MRLANPLLVLPLAVGAVLASGAAMTTPASAQSCECVAPDVAGTAALPVSCTYYGDAEIIDGLPPGATIVISAILQNPTGASGVPGGSLGGMMQTYTADLVMQMNGTGTLAGFNRLITIPLSIVETHSAPRTPFQPVQAFVTDLYRLQGQVCCSDDPDFDLLRISAGTNLGLPSPGQTRFTQMGPLWSVDSFFDITYRIDFVGRSGGSLTGMSGSTTGGSRYAVCGTEPVAARPSTWGQVKALY